MSNLRKPIPAFTLAELLIALAILGVIATFTIPKILATQQTQQYNAIAKDDIHMIVGAYQQYVHAMCTLMAIQPIFCLLI